MRDIRGKEKHLTLLDRDVVAFTLENHPQQHIALELVEELLQPLVIDNGTEGVECGMISPRRC